MKKDEFKQRIKKLNLTQENFAELFNQGYSTVKGWKVPPVWVDYILDYLELSNQLSEAEISKQKIKDLNQKVQNLDSKNKTKN